MRKTARWFEYTTSHQKYPPPWAAGMTSQSAHVLEDAAQDFIHKICAMARMLKDSSHSAASTKVCGHHHLELLGGPTPPTTTCFPSPLTNWCWLCFCGLCLVVTRVALMLGRQWLLPLSGRLCPVGCTASAGATTSEEGGERLGGGWQLSGNKGGRLGRNAPLLLRFL